MATMPYQNNMQKGENFRNYDFDKDKERSRAPKQFVDEALEALLYDNSCQNLAESLGDDHTTVLKCLKLLGRVQ